MTKVERSRAQNQQRTSEQTRNKAQAKNQLQNLTRDFKDAGTIASIANDFETRRKPKQWNKPRQKKRTEKIANLGKVRVGMTKIERSRPQNQKTKKQTNEKQSSSSRRRRRESNPRFNPRFQRCSKIQFQA
jgi:hypothetical protein